MRNKIPLKYFEDAQKELDLFSKLLEEIEKEKKKECQYYLGGLFCFKRRKNITDKLCFNFLLPYGASRIRAVNGLIAHINTKGNIASIPVLKSYCLNYKNYLSDILLSNKGNKFIILEDFKTKHSEKISEIKKEEINFSNSEIGIKDEKLLLAIKKMNAEISTYYEDDLKKIKSKIQILCVELYEEFENISPYNEFKLKSFAKYIYPYIKHNEIWNPKSFAGGIYQYHNKDKKRKSRGNH